ncbi:hypothetical protein PV327_005308 [Microctonus hyperodae]|uniref:Protein artemis n=1 Tax=Microctonus hyperodae TaxID=165561 RepID=A0AA39G131_MICHY|nr:hypothetical protein PV327_005308 [Microctonus hyperodae]
MSSFPGLIDEIPGISVDRFNGDNFNSAVFFLSHCHTDHMQGLDLQFFQRIHDKHQYLYCTPISKAILINMFKLNDNLVNTIRTIDGCSPIIINYNQDSKILYLTVTCIPAGHCPGSIGFLFENEQYRILYTGDFRFDIDDLSKIKPLHTNVQDKIIPKKFDTIYLDTTFFNSEFRYLPSRQKALREICKIVDNWISQNEKNIVVLECSANYGPEHLFIELSKALGIRIHVKDKVFNSYTIIPELANCISDNPRESKIHACMGKLNFRSGMYCRSDVEPEFILTVVPSTLRWRNKNVSKCIFEWDENSRRFYVCYSCHSSHDELEAFIKYFSPDKLYPCVCPNNLKFEEFKSQLNQVLNSSTINASNYDLNLSRYKSLIEVNPDVSNFSDDD